MLYFFIVGRLRSITGLGKLARGRNAEDEV